MKTWECVVAFVVMAIVLPAVVGVAVTKIMFALFPV